MGYFLSRASVSAFFIVTLHALALPPTVTVIHETRHGVSAPLRTLTNPSATLWATGGDAEDEEEKSPAATPAPYRADPVLQQIATRALVTVPGMNILGLGSGFTGPSGSSYPHGVPPDPNAAVGDTQIVEVVNLAIAVFNKTTGAVIMGPLFIGSLWQSFDTDCSNGSSLADPVVLFDKQAKRWVIKNGTLATPYTACLAVSQTSDATGAYNLYAYQIQADGTQTGQKLATWIDGYYLATRITNNSVYAGPSACAVDRSQMLIGQTATMQCVQINNPKLTNMDPSNMDGSVAPPTGSPNYFLMQGPAGSNKLFLYRFHVDFTNPANTKLTGPVQISVAAYTESGNIPQFGTAEMLHSNGDTIRPQIQYRNFPNASPPHESLILTHSIVTGSGSTKGVGMRWYELRNPAGKPVVYQQGTYAPDTNYRWMGAIAMDSAGDIALGYSLSTKTAYPSVLYTGRVPTDPAGAMETEVVIFNGSGNQSDSVRWGDYTSMSLDPDDCTFWYTGEYLAAPASKNWATRLFSFTFPGCQTAPSPQPAPAVSHPQP